MADIVLPDGRIPVVLSAHADELVSVDAEAILRYLDRGVDVRAVAATLLRTRRVRRHRTVTRAADLAELADGLRAVLTGDDHPLVARSSESAAARTVFVFPGQGSQWPSMGAEAYRRLPEYRTQADRCAAAFVAAGADSPLAYLTAASEGGHWSQVEVQGAQFSHAVGLAQVWRSCGVQPDMVVGHSLGEVAAAYVAGTLGLADAVAVVIARAKAVDSLSGDYGMAALGVSADEAHHLAATISGWLEVSAVNASASVVVSGDRDAVSALVAAASGRGMFARELDVDYPGHTSALESLRDDLIAMLPVGQFADSAVRFIGSANGAEVTAGTDFADYWYANLRSTVRFDRAVAAAQQHDARVFVEMSAHPSLLFALGDLTGGGPGDPLLVVGSGLRGEPLVDTLSANIVTVATADPGYRWADLVDTDVALLRGFPNAPMRATRLWAEPQALPPVHPLTLATETWQQNALAALAAPRNVAVVELRGPASRLGDRLRAAVVGHDAATLTEPREADLVVAVAPLLDHPDAELATQQISDLIGAGLLGYVDACAPTCRELCLVTVGGEHVRPGEPVALPAQAALAAMHRSIGFEHPDLGFRHLDLPSWDVDDTMAAVAVDALLGEIHEAAVRDSASGPSAYTRELRDVVETVPAWRLDAGLLDNVVITGGSGAVGLHFARYLADRGARRIVLLSRSGVPAAIIDDLADTGAQISAPECDVTSVDALTAAASEYGGDGATLLIHAAGAAGFADRANVTSEMFADAVSAKVGGLSRMVELWPMRSDARIVVCSSVSGVWGGRGHAAYSAANRMLDVVAGQLRAKGQHCVSVKYGLWQTDPGCDSAITARADVASIERSGLLPMPPEMAVAESLRDHPADPLIMVADHDRLRTFLDSQVVSPDSTVVTPIADADTVATVRAELAAVLNVDAAAIDLQTSLLDLGVDSLLALDLRKRLRRATGTSVPLASLLGGITGGELIASIDDPGIPVRAHTGSGNHA